jgi:hypothetical protein
MSRRTRRQPRASPEQRRPDERRQQERPYWRRTLPSRRAREAACSIDRSRSRQLQRDQSPGRADCSCLASGRGAASSPRARPVQRRRRAASLALPPVSLNRRGRRRRSDAMRRIRAARPSSRCGRPAPATCIGSSRRGSTPGGAANSASRAAFWARCAVCRVSRGETRPSVEARGEVPGLPRVPRSTARFGRNASRGARFAATADGPGCAEDVDAADTVAARPAPHLR